MKGDQQVLVVRVISKVLVFFSFFGQAQKLPLVQRAYVMENRAIVYSEPDFDSKQLAHLPRNRVIAVSTKIYRPKNLFGSFYKVFVNKPKKIRGYISEVDIVTQFNKTKSGFRLNPIYRQKENILKRVKDQSSIGSFLKEDDNKKVKKDKKIKKDNQEKKVSRKNIIGIIGGWHLPLFGVDLKNSSKFLGLQGVYTSPVINDISVDWRLSYSLQAPKNSSSGWIVEGHIFPLLFILKQRDYLFHFGGGLAWKLEKSYRPKKDEQLKLGIGGSLGAVVHAFSSLHVKIAVEYNLFLLDSQNIGLWGGIMYDF